MTSAGGLYEKVLAAAGGELGAPKAPRPSAAVVLFRRQTGEDLELFWLQRGEVLPFMGGWHAFPGGGLERGDVDLPALFGGLVRQGAPPDALSDSGERVLRLFEDAERRWPAP